MMLLNLSGPFQMYEANNKISAPRTLQNSCLTLEQVSIFACRAACIIYDRSERAERVSIVFYKMKTAILKNVAANRILVECDP